MLPDFEARNDILWAASTEFLDTLATVLNENWKGHPWLWVEFRLFYHMEKNVKKYKGKIIGRLG